MAMNAGGFLAGSIVAKMFLDASGWKASVDQIKKDEVTLKNSAQKIGQSFTLAFKVAAAAATATIGTLGLIVKKTADAGDAFNDMSKRVGISVEQLSAYDLLAKKTGTSMEGLGVAFRGLSSRMLDASRGLEAQKQTFDELGIKITDGSGKLRSMNDVLLDVADRFSRMEDGTKKAAYAQDLFGRSGMELIPMLNEGRAAILANIDAARRLGLVWSTEDARAADNFNDSLAELTGGIRGISNDIGKALIPVFTTLVQAGTEAVANIRKHLATLAADGSLHEWAIGLAKTFVTSFKIIAKSVEGLALLFPSIKAAAQGVWGWLQEKVGDIADAFGKAQADFLKKHPNENAINFYQDFADMAHAQAEKMRGLRDKNIEYASDIVASFDVLFRELDNIIINLAKPPAQISAIANETTNKLPPAIDVFSSLTKETKAATSALEDLDSLLGKGWGAPFQFGESPFKSWTPEQWDQDLEESFRLIREKAAQTGKETKRVVDETAHYFDGLFNDLATGFGDALEGMFDGTKSFAEGFKDIWLSIKKTFFRILGEMVAGFIVNFVKKLAAGMKLLDALKGALGLGKIIGAVGAGAVGAAGAGATGAAGAGMTITNTGALAPIASGAGGASASLIAGYAAPVAFAALWLGTLFGKIFGKSAFEKWTEEYTRRMNQRFGVGGWSFMEGPMNINQLRDPGASYSVPSTWSGKRRRSTPKSGLAHPASGDINLNVSIQAIDGADVERVVRKKIIPTLREAARRREFTIPFGAVGGA